MAAPDPQLIEPLGDRVLIETITESTNRAGIILPEVAQGRPERGRVLAVGPGRRLDKTGEMVPLPVDVGDEVIFHRHAGVHVGSFDDSFIIFREQDLLARVRPEPDALA